MNYYIVKNERIVSKTVFDESEDSQLLLNMLLHQGDLIATEEVFNVGDNYLEVLTEQQKAEIKLKQQEEEYNNLVQLYILEKYTLDQENKIIREFLADNKKAEFDEYNNYVSECKTRAYEEVYSSEC